VSFDVFLCASSTSPAGAAAKAATDAALARCGARRGGEGEFELVLADGSGQEYFEDGDTAGGMFALRGLDAERAQVIFQIAEATQCFIVAAQDPPTSFRTPANSGEPPEGAEGMEVVTIARAEELLARLSGGVERWSDYRDQVVESYAPPPKPISKLGSLWRRLTKGSD